MTILKQQLIVGGLRIIKNLVEDCQEEPEESEQPPLPIMRNNDQRKEWLRNYKAWGLWYTDESHRRAVLQVRFRERRPPDRRGIRSGRSLCQKTAGMCRI